MSTREHVLMIAAALVAVAFGYWIFRHRPHADRLGKLAFQTDWTRQRLDGVKWPEDKGDPATLQRELDSLARETAAARARLGTLEGRFVSLGRPGEREELRLAISALADRHDVRFRETMACPTAALRQFLGDAAHRPAGSAADLVRGLALGEPYELEVRQVTLDAGFAGLLAFLEGLDQLEHRVIVLRFEIEVRDGADARPLRVKLLMGM
jgi:hypothetical protein